MKNWVGGTRRFVETVGQDLKNLTNRIDAITLEDMGGMNLIPGSTEKDRNYTISANQGSFVIGSYLSIHETEFISYNDTVTASVNVESSKYPVSIMIVLKNPVGNTNIESSESTKKGYITVTTSIPASNNIGSFEVHILSKDNRSNPVVYNRVKLEKGKFATDWGPYYGDIEERPNRDAGPISNVNNIISNVKAGGVYEVAQAGSLNITATPLGTEFTIINTYSGANSVSTRDSELQLKTHKTTGALVSLGTLEDRTSYKIMVTRSLYSEPYGLVVSESNLV